MSQQTSNESLRALTLYLPEEEVERLKQEARDAGRSGASSQIRWILFQRRVEIEK